MGQLTRVGQKNTSFYNARGERITRKQIPSIQALVEPISVRYHDTNVITFNKDKIILDSGGWCTVTTKNRINQAAREFNLPIAVIQHQRVWYVRTPDGDVDFKDKMEIKYKR